MARIVMKKAKAPQEVECGDKKILICMCGLSKKQPFCDGSHSKTEGEDDNKIYEYDENGNRQEICGENCDCNCECGEEKDNECKCNDSGCKCDNN